MTHSTYRITIADVKASVEEFSRKKNKIAGAFHNNMLTVVPKAQ